MARGAEAQGNPASDVPLDADMLRKVDAWWRAANYLSVGQTYLFDNPLLKTPLKKEHVKPRLVGHWTNHKNFHVRGYKEEGTMRRSSTEGDNV